MDVHQQIPVSQPPSSPLPGPSAAKSSRKRVSHVPTSLSGELLLVVIIGIVAVQLGVILVALVIAVGSASGPALLPSQTEPGGQLTLLGNWVILLLALWSIIFLTLAIHEGGHALAARLGGYWFYQCKIGPLVITRAPRGFYLGLTRNAPFWGYVAAHPLYWRRIRLRHAIFSGGGPLASLLWLAVSIWLCTLIKPSAVHTVSAALWLIILLGWTLLIELLFLLSSLVPFTSRKGFQSDGLRQLKNLRGDSRLELEMLLSYATGQLRRGIRPRAWPADLAAQLRAMLQRFPADRSLLRDAYALALDQRQIQEAGAILDQIAQTVAGGPPAGDSLALIFAFFEARHRGNLAVARAWLAQAPNTSSSQALLRLRAEAAIFLLENRPAEAQASISLGLAALSQFKKISLQGVQMEEDSLREMLAEVQPSS